MKLGAPLVRGIVGPLFVGHGAQKLFGLFGGGGLEGTTGTMEKLELRPARRHALMAGLAETGGGALLTLGALTPLATTVLTSTMVTAIRRVHARNGVWNTGGGWEYNAVLIGAVTALADNGPGRPALMKGPSGPAWAIASLAAGVAGSYLATSPVLNEPAPAPAPAPSGNGEVRRPEPAPA